LQEYLQMLTQVAERAERIFFVGLPTSRVQHEEWASAYRARNAAMKACPSSHARISALLPGALPAPLAVRLLRRRVLPRPQHSQHELLTDWHSPPHYRV